MNSNTRWLIVGGGVSGLGAAEFLTSRGQVVRISDGGTIIGERRRRLESLRVEIRDGGHSLDHLEGVTDVVISPSVTLDNLVHTAARERGLRVHTELDLALSDYSGTVIAITGTNGKSTTCVMIDHLMRRLGLDSRAGGNLGEPPTAMAAEHRLGTHLSLEVSSYQLEFTSTLRPVASVFTSFSHDHLKRHGTLAGYMAAKLRVFENMGPSHRAIMPSTVLDAIREHGQLNMRCPADVISPHDACPADIRDLPTGSRRLVFDGMYRLKDAEGSLVCDFTESELSERHNILNAAFSVLSVAHVTGRSPQSLVPLLRDFQGLPFRCQTIGSWDGEPVINDSKSTNVESTLVALASQNKPVLLILGGLGKDESFLPLLDLRHRIDRVLAVGHTGPAIERELREHLSVTLVPTLAEALRDLPRLRGAAPLPILFSPGCASFDEFKNFENRGDFFNETMKQWMKQRS